MQSLIGKFKKISTPKKIQGTVASVLTVCILFAIPAYAWFVNQKKAAEMYKVEYPNSLYINAAHREDKMFFKLDSINVNEYLRDENNNIKTDENGNPIFVKEKSYIFSVSGSNADKFVLQMAHTNNNMFTYEIYEATQYDYLSSNCPDGTDTEKIVPSDTPEENIIEYKTNPGGYTENPLVFASDPVNKESSETKYYVIGNLTEGTYKNNQSNNEKISPENLAKNGDIFYSENYGSNIKVEAHAIPSYWQGEFETQNINKQFCRYFILKVKWDSAVVNTQQTKESDMIYFSVKRKD